MFECVLYAFSEDFAPDEIEVQVREHILQDLEAFIRRHIEGEGETVDAVNSGACLRERFETVA